MAQDCDGGKGYIIVARKQREKAGAGDKNVLFRSSLQGPTSLSYASGNRTLEGDILNHNE